MLYVTTDVEVSGRDVFGGAGEVEGTAVTGGKGTAGVGDGSSGTSPVGVAEGAGAGGGVLLQPMVVETMTRAVMAMTSDLRFTG